MGGTARRKTLLDDRRVYSRLGSECLTLEPLSTTELVEEARARLGESGGQMDLADLPWVCGHAFQLTQLFGNLIGNALKFRLSGVAPEVRISAVRARSSSSACVTTASVFPLWTRSGSA